MLVQSIKITERAGLVHELYKDTSGIGVLTKPEKLYLNNGNLMFTLPKENTNVGNVRETFFLNQFSGYTKLTIRKRPIFTLTRSIHLK